MVLLPSFTRGIILALFTFGVLTLFYPAALKRLARPRWLVIFGSLFLVNLFFGVPDQTPDLDGVGLVFFIHSHSRWHANDPARYGHSACGGWAFEFGQYRRSGRLVRTRRFARTWFFHRRGDQPFA